MNDRLRRLGEQLEAIEQALRIAREETDPGRRGRWLDVVGHAVDAAKEEHELALREAEDAERARPHLRVIEGGLASVLGALAFFGGFLRELWSEHRGYVVGTAVGAATAATTTATLLVIVPWDTGTDQQPPSSAPTATVTAPPSPSTRSPSPTSSAPAPSTSQSSPLPPETPSTTPTVTANITPSPSPSPSASGPVQTGGSTAVPADEEPTQTQSAPDGDSAGPKAPAEPGEPPAGGGEPSPVPSPTPTGGGASPLCVLTAEPVDVEVCLSVDLS